MDLKYWLDLNKRLENLGALETRVLITIGFEGVQFHVTAVLNSAITYQRIITVSREMVEDARFDTSGYVMQKMMDAFEKALGNQGNEHA